MGAPGVGPQRGSGYSRPCTARCATAGKRAMEEWCRGSRGRECVCVCVTFGGKGELLERFWHVGRLLGSLPVRSERQALRLPRTAVPGERQPRVCRTHQGPSPLPRGGSAAPPVAVGTSPARRGTAQWCERPQGDGWGRWSSKQGTPLTLQAGAVSPDVCWCTHFAQKVGSSVF